MAVIAPVTSVAAVVAVAIPVHQTATAGLAVAAVAVVTETHSVFADDNPVAAIFLGLV